ncbi:SGNH/GDSL hydrolase family protein [Klebsiella pneumoniae]|uniref:SGNH/GDSL hydrolase family protein n=1 Tax=Klebsiella pneumoniae TaxID=573 RepID=UPI00388F2604
MANLPETPSWESAIHQLEEADRAKAGPGGILNLQASQLANRTIWLRILIESVIDYREFTFYKSESDPDGTIKGLSSTPDGKLFRVVQGVASELSFIYYLNKSGVAVPVALMPGQGAIDSLKEVIKNDYTPAGYDGAVTDPDGHAAILFTDRGGVEVLELISGDSTSTGEDMPGYTEARTDPHGNVAFGIRHDGTVEAPELMSGGLHISKQSMPGWAKAFTDDEGNVAFGIHDNGSVEAPDFFSGGIYITKEEIKGWVVAWTDPYGNIGFGLREDGSVYPDTSGVSSIEEFSANDADIIAILGDSYTDSLFTLRDKSYIGNLSSLSDYRFRNYGISGNTATAINKRLVDDAVYFDGKKFAQMKAKYAIIMTYANDAGWFINHGMEYYLHNISRLIDSVMAYGAVPIIVAEWMIFNEAAAQLRALCEQRGVAFIYNANFMKEVGNLALSNFHQGHPGTRTNGVIWASLFEHLRRMPRPTRSIKIYRQRSTFSPSGDADMLFSDRINMLEKWKEIRVSHRSLPDAVEPYFEELRGRGDVTTWQVRADEYDLLGGDGVAFTDRLLVNITYPAGSVGLKKAGFKLTCSSGVEIYIRRILDRTSSIGQAGDATPGAADRNTLTPDYLAKYKLPCGAWVKIGSGSGEYLFAENLEQVMFGDQIQVMLKSTSGTLVDIIAKYQVGGSPAVKYPLMEYRPQSQLLGETFEDFSTWATNGVTRIVPLDQVNTPRNLTYNGPLETVASLMSGSTMKKTVSVVMPATRDFTQSVKLQVELWARYFPKAYLDNSIYKLDPTQVVDSSQPGNTFPASSPITSDTCDFRNVTLRTSLGATMTPQNTITQSDFTCLFWRPLKYIIEIPPYVSVSQLTLEITSESDYVQMAKIFIKEVY